jgi:hypothetical protein
MDNTSTSEMPGAYPQDAFEHSTVTVTACCLCKANRFTAEVSRSELPLPVSACHCKFYRESTGALFSIRTNWPWLTRPLFASIDPQFYGVSLKSFYLRDSSSVVFCPTCSTPLFRLYKDYEDTPDVFTGTLENIEEEELFDIRLEVCCGALGRIREKQCPSHGGSTRIVENIRHKPGMGAVLSVKAPVDRLSSRHCSYLSYSFNATCTPTIGTCGTKYVTVVRCSAYSWGTRCVKLVNQKARVS